LEVKLCLEEMAPDLPGEVVLAQEKVWVEVAGAEVGWEVIVLESVPVAVVSALIVVLGCLIKQGHPATI